MFTEKFYFKNAKIKLSLRHNVNNLMNCRKIIMEIINDSLILQIWIISAEI